MEGGSLNVQRLFAQHPLQTFLELTGSLVGEGDGKDVPWLDRTVGDQSGKAVAVDVTVVQFAVEPVLQKGKVLLADKRRDVLAVVGVAKFDHVGDTVDHHGGLAAACARQNQDGAFGLKDRLTLFVIHVGKPLFQHCAPKLQKTLLCCLCHLIDQTFLSIVHNIL